MKRLALSALAAVPALIAALLVVTSSPAAAGTCAGDGSTPHAYKHVLVWMLENHDQGTTRGHMPYLDSIADECAYTTNLRAITHPSLPNYLADTGGSTFGVTDDAGPGSHKIAGASIYSQVSWGGYHDGMVHNCSLKNEGDHYIVHHNPAPYYTAIRAACLQNDRPYSELAAALSEPALEPQYLFVVPNNCHNGHKNTCVNGDGTTVAGQALQADDFLASHLPDVLASPAYLNGDLLIEITWDEGKGTKQQIYTVLVAPDIVPGTVISSSLTAYSLLRYNEDTFGVPRLRAAATAPALVLP